MVMPEMVGLTHRRAQRPAAHPGARHREHGRPQARRVRPDAHVQVPLGRPQGRVGGADMQVTSKLRYARISPQKCRLVADVVRGKPAGNALATLKYMPKKGAELVRKVLDVRRRQCGAQPRRRHRRAESVPHPRGRGPGAQALRRPRQGARRAHRQAQQSHHRRGERRQEGLTHGSEGQSARHSARHHAGLELRAGSPAGSNSRRMCTPTSACASS